jgi:ubiquinone/menaquinone biosynthesis C-methylase UbiE
VSARLTAGVVRSDNEAKYRSRNPIVRQLVGRFLAHVAVAVVRARPRRVLEVGCGEGVVLEYLADRNPSSRFDGLELDPAALARARLRCPRTTLVRGDVYALPFPDQSYDLVLCLEVLEHLPDPARALREIRRVARRGLLLSVPHEPFFRLGNALRGRHLGRLGNPEDHLQHWSARGFAAFCAEHVTVESCTSAFPWLLVHGIR